MSHLLSLLHLCLIVSSVYAQNVDWAYYAASATSTKHAPLDQINEDNFTALEIAWRYTPPDRDIADFFGLRHDSNRGTPLVIDGILYYGSPMNFICAIDAKSGKELWVFDPKSWKKPNSFFGNLKGISYWRDGNQQRIFFGTSNARLFSIDAITGKVDAAFANNGSIDLTQGLRHPVEADNYGVTSPPIICNNVIIIGSAIKDLRNRTPRAYTPPGSVRGYDAHTGTLLWTFHTIAQPGETGHETWENTAWDTYGSANVWAVMSADIDLGYVYLPVSTPSHDFYGGERPGDNLFGDSLVCLEAKTGTLVWYFQLIHHGLWDYDPPAAPILMDITVNGKAIKAVAQVTKQAFTYVFNRETGEPIWPIEEKPVPQSKAKGEKTARTQPIPTKPAAFDRQGLSESDLIDFTPELRQQAKEKIAAYEFGPLYTPPTEKGTILMPGLLGGADWAGAAVHPQTGILYIPSHTKPDIVTLEPPRRSSTSAYVADIDNLSGPQGLPLTKPPYGRLTAIDMNTGNHLWMRPVGQGPTDHPAIRHLNLPAMGWPNRSFIALTNSLVLIAPQERDLSALLAFDPASGALLGQVDLPNNASGSPMTYMTANQQYIVIPISSRWNGPELIALALPSN